MSPHILRKRGVYLFWRRVSLAKLTFAWLYRNPPYYLLYHFHYPKPCSHKPHTNKSFAKEHTKPQIIYKRVSPDYQRPENYIKNNRNNLISKRENISLIKTFHHIKSNKRSSKINKIEVKESKDSSKKEIDKDSYNLNLNSKNGYISHRYNIDRKK